MNNIGIELYKLNNEYDITNILSKFDSNYIFDIINDKLENISFATSLIEPNIVNSFETNFKMMNEQFPGDSQNIRTIRDKVYRDIIQILTERFNLQFNVLDDTIDPYTAAYYAYDFLICNRNNIMINFFTTFIMNNKDSLYKILNLEDYKKNKDSAAAYSKRIYNDQQYAVISANIPNIINYICNLDISLLTIFQLTYKDINLVRFLDNAFADKGNFFKDYYCISLQKIEEIPIIITNIKLSLQSQVSINNSSSLEEYLKYAGGN